MPTGKPCKIPNSDPDITSSSAFFACLRTSALSIATTAFTSAFNLSICSMQLFVNSNGESCLFPINFLASTASRSQGLVIYPP